MSISELVRQEAEKVEQTTIVAPKAKIYATVDDIPELTWYEKITAAGLAVGSGLIMIVPSLAFIDYARNENPALFLVPAVGAALFLARGVDARGKGTDWSEDLSNKPNDDVNEV